MKTTIYSIHAFCSIVLKYHSKRVRGGLTFIVSVRLCVPKVCLVAPCLCGNFSDTPVRCVVLNT